jgi:bifunctional DNase/RNase
MALVRVTIDSVRVSLMSQQRIVILKDADSDRYLPIWIGPCEADAITVELQEVEVPRPLTHDLLRSVIEKMGAEVAQILVSELRDDVFYARVVLDVNGKEMEVDSRPSDAIALAVRSSAPIFVDDSVMDKAAIEPEEEVEAEAEEGGQEDGARLDVFKDFVETLDLDDIDDEEGSKSKN